MSVESVKEKLFEEFRLYGKVLLDSKRSSFYGKLDSSEKRICMKVINDLIADGILELKETALILTKKGFEIVQKDR